MHIIKKKKTAISLNLQHQQVLTREAFDMSYDHRIS